MYPGMVFAVLSRDPDFVQDIAVLLRNAGAEVFAAGSWEEYARLQEEGVVVEIRHSQAALPGERAPHGRHVSE